MKIVVAKMSGFCMGVRRAVEMVLDAPDRHPGPICTYGPLIHHPQVQELLESKDISTLKTIPDCGTGTVLIRAHGVPPETNKRLKASGFKVIDATCPRVIRVQSIIRKHAKQDHAVIIIGDKDHRSQGHRGRLRESPGRSARAADIGRQAAARHRETDRGRVRGRRECHRGRRGGGAGRGGRREAGQAARPVHRRACAVPLPVAHGGCREPPHAAERPLRFFPATVSSQVYDVVCLRGEKRFSFMWELALKKAEGALFLLATDADKEHAAFFSARAACLGKPVLRVCLGANLRSSTGVQVIATPADMLRALSALRPAAR